MSTFFDENGNPVTTNNETNTPTFPEQPPRKVELNLKDKNNENYAKVNSDGSLEVKVTEMPPIEISTGDITISNEVEITNDSGNPIPVQGNVNATVSGTVAVSNQPTSINVGNFPTTQAVNIADTVEVSFAEGQVVTISNPTTDVSVNNFPTQFDVNVLNAPSSEVEVTNFPSVQDVNITNAISVEMPENQSVTVSNESLDVNVLNPVSEVTVSNFPASQNVIIEGSMVSIPTTINGINTSDTLNVNVVNPTSSVEISNFPTEVAINNLPATQNVNIQNANLNVTVSNPTESVSVNNLPANQNVTITNEQLTVTVDNQLTALDVVVSNEVEVKNDANNPLNVQGTVSANVSGTISVDNFPTEMEIKNDINNPILVQGSVNATVGGTVNSKIVSSAGQEATIGNYNGQDALNVGIIGGNVSVNNTTSNRVPTTTVVTQLPQLDINSLPEIEIKNDNNNPIPISGTVVVSNLPSSTEINNDSGNPIPVVFSSTPTVEIQNEQGNPITVSLSSINPNPTNPLYVASYNPLDVTVGNEVTIKNGLNPLSISGSVFVNNLPTSTEISNDSGNPVPVNGTVNVGNFPFTQNVSFNGISQPVSIQGTPSVNVLNHPTNFEISNDNGNPIPVSFPTTPSVNAIISGTPSVNATIQGTPTVRISNVTGQIIGTEINNALGVITSSNPLHTTITGTPTVNISGTPSVNATLVGTPTVEINNNVGNPITTTISNSELNVTSSGGIRVYNDISNPIFTEINNGLGNPIGVEISGTPTVSISGTPTVSATISGTPTVEITNTPSVNATLVGTPTVSISGTPNVSATITGTPTVIQSVKHNVGGTGINRNFISGGAMLGNGASVTIITQITGYSIILDKLTIFCDPTVTSPANTTFQVSTIGGWAFDQYLVATATGAYYEIPLPDTGLRLPANQALTLTNGNTSTTTASTFQYTAYYRFV